MSFTILSIGVNKLLPKSHGPTKHTQHLGNWLWLWRRLYYIALEMTLLILGATLKSKAYDAFGLWTILLRDHNPLEERYAVTYPEHRSSKLAAWKTLVSCGHGALMCQLHCCNCLGAAEGQQEVQPLRATNPKP